MKAVITGKPYKEENPLQSHMKVRVAAKLNIPVVPFAIYLAENKIDYDEIWSMCDQATFLSFGADLMRVVSLNGVYQYVLLKPRALELLSSKLYASKELKSRQGYPLDFFKRKL